MLGREGERLEEDKGVLEYLMSPLGKVFPVEYNRTHMYTQESHSSLIRITQPVPSLSRRNVILFNPKEDSH